MNPIHNKTANPLIHNGLVLEKAPVVTSVEIETDIAIWHETTRAIGQRSDPMSAKITDSIAEKLIKAENDEASAKLRTASEANQQTKV